MKIKSIATIWVFCASLQALSASIQAENPAETADQFLTSFLQHYEFGPEGRYVHEYHPFVLQKTRESFLQLEETIRAEGMNVEGRMSILGYEEQGGPSYYTDFMKPKIDDEAMVKGKAGWSLKLHNRFGFMTGFLMKDVNRIANANSLGENQIFEHIDPDMLLVFNDRARIFQEHAFGQALPLMSQTKTTIDKLIARGGSKDILRALIPFWSKLYSGELKVGNSQIAGTQDILFSIEYGRYVLSSQTPIKRCFVGPDITYPIEIFAKQKKEVTQHSQAFVKKFAPNLKAVNDEATAYIFCSFVDGVGKSTMLGNIKNWMKHGSNVNLYDHVDNSSSQLAELFQFSKDVFIADLPAQMSHFTYKPDGMVYVDVRTEFTDAQYSALDAAILPIKEAMIAQYRTKLEEIKQLITEKGNCAEELISNAQMHFLRNLLILKKDTDNVWIPCTIDDQEYLFNMAADGEYRALRPLGAVKSEGLKNIESDQMLFMSGIRLPLPYNVFLHDLVTRLKEQDIKHVIFVDFLSMYPRSSRENIRVNYLLQQMGLLDAEFNVATSMYRNFISGGELLFYLLQQNTCNKMVHALELEAQIRWLLFSMIINRKEGDLSGYTEAELTEKLLEGIKEGLPAKAENNFKKGLNRKLNHERRELSKRYGKSKSFVNVQLFSMADAYLYYKALQEFIDNNVESSFLEYVWDELGPIHENQTLSRAEQGYCEDIETFTQNGKKVTVLYKIHEKCRSEALLAPFLRLLRQSWITTIINLFAGKPGQYKMFNVEHVMFPHVPLHLSKGLDGYWYVIQEKFQRVEEDVEIPEYANVLKRLFGVPKQTPCELVSVGDIPSITAFPHLPTNTGIFDYDCTLDRNKTNYCESAMTKLVRKLQKEASVDIVTPLVDAFNGIMSFSAWATEHRSLLEKIDRKIIPTPDYPNGLYDLLYPSEEDLEKQANPSFSYMSSLPIHRSIKTILYGDVWQQEISREALRLWFTLDMIIKDPEGELVIRNKNPKDIASSVTFLEAFVLPKYLGFCFEHNLFPDYEAIELFPTNDYWQHLVPQLDED